VRKERKKEQTSEAQIESGCLFFLVKKQIEVAFYLQQSIFIQRK